MKSFTTIPRNPKLKVFWDHGFTNMLSSNPISAAYWDCKEHYYDFIMSLYHDEIAATQQCEARLRKLKERNKLKEYNTASFKASWSYCFNEDGSLRALYRDVFINGKLAISAYIECGKNNKNWFWFDSDRRITTKDIERFFYGYNYNQK